MFFHDIFFTIEVLAFKDCSSFFKMFINLFGERENESTHTSGGGAEGEGERQNPKQAPHCRGRVPDSRLKLMN